jgi:hypothetical protein
VDVVLDEVAVRSQMPTKRTDARLSPSESETTESPQWPKGFWGQTGVACRLRLVVSENETVTGSANASVIVIVTGNETETTIDPPDRAVMTTATMNANEGTGKMSGRGPIAAALIVDHTRNSTMETSDPPVPDAVDPMTKTTMLPATHAMPRGLRESDLESERHLVLKNVLVRKPQLLQLRMFIREARRVRSRRIRVSSVDCSFF